MLNHYHAFLNLGGKERRQDRLVGICGAPRTPPARVLEGAQVTLETKRQLVVKKELLNPFALKQETKVGLK
jgi:hypothetical protein